MQIQHSQVTPSIATTQSNRSVDINTTATSKLEQSVQVSISEQAHQVAKSDNPSALQANQSTPVTLPVEPSSPLSGEKLAQAVQFKKAQMQYQAVADMANLVTGNNQGISASSAYYLSQNEDAREFVLTTKSQQQTLENMANYQQQTNSLNEQYA